ncbi:fibrobacter succinogenes major paralogous domain-containing protein [uncultured Muribaculum sp.]|uniref:fibrobacter succinogenes major paralogous domain-containing protein n=1 Tax=uncultured Muribaculum sp. TaxID=1918613 RepID=UPI00266EA3EB|nr:fibrobacter succinogenes major paralogous domain-containing protein [uncultured Muribaculum sp.]
MKKFILPSILMLATAAYAQNQSPAYSLTVHLKSGESVEYRLTDIDRMTFEANDDKPQENSVAAFPIPTSFTDSYVKKVMHGGKQVAEIAREYIRSINKQVTVVYPCDENGKADLTKGITANGAPVEWDTDANTATVGDEGNALGTVYVVDGAIATAYDGATSEATITDDVIVDQRGLERNTYAIVKIGTQYWMAENLRATCYADGSSITKISATETDAWKNNTSGAYLEGADPEWVKAAGLLYNGYCVTGEKSLAPQGWEIPTQEQLSKLRTAGNLATTNFKSAEEMAWGDGMTGNNITGFSAIATGYYSTSTGLASELTETYFWSATKYYDALERGDVLDYFRITGTGKNVVVSSSMLGGHGLRFGHAIRCIRK